MSVLDRVQKVVQRTDCQKNKTVLSLALEGGYNIVLVELTEYPRAEMVVQEPITQLLFRS
jgi:hypothetical protein